MNEHIVLSLDRVSVRYGRLLAVDGLTLALRAGEIFGLLGPNGSGKSSTLSAIAGVIAPSMGCIQINGISWNHAPTEYTRRIGYVPQEPSLYEELSAWANLDFFGRLHGLGGRALTQRIESVLDLVKLRDRCHDRLSVYSGGMLRRINLACALLHNPPVLLLDEPTVALDPESRDSLFRTLNQLRDEGRTILLTTHHLDEAEQWCDRVGVLVHGKLIAEGRPAEILREDHSRSVVQGQMRESLAEQAEMALRAQLGPGIDLQISGRSIVLSATDGARLGQALAAIHTRGIQLESFRTPAARIDRLFCLNGENTPEEPCFIK